MEEMFLRQAIELARQKMNENAGGPFGALIVREGEVVASGWNCVTSNNDPTAHAEIVAIRSAAARLKTFRLDGCQLYSSCEPCPMCLAAIYWARLDQVCFAAAAEDAAKAGFDDAMIYQELRRSPEGRRLAMTQGLRTDAQQVFSEWLQKSDRVEY